MSFKWNNGRVVRRKPKKTHLSLKLAKRISEELGIKVIPIIHRTYSGYNQKSIGAWSWFMRTQDGRYDVGSCWTVKQIMSSKKLTVSLNIGSIEIFPKEK